MGSRVDREFSSGSLIRWHYRSVAFSRLGTMVARSAPTSMLVGLQVFRLPLELVLFRLSLDGVLPVQMTFDGMNYDIASGVVAGIVGLWASWREPPRIVVLLWNVMGLALLATIVTKTVWPDSRFSSPRNLDAPWRTISRPAASRIATSPSRTAMNG